MIDLTYATEIIIGEQRFYNVALTKAEIEIINASRQKNGAVDAIRELIFSRLPDVV